MSFFDVIYQFPRGSGLVRAWGTALPFFLQGMALPQIGIENEFARIVIDTGLPGLLWMPFFVWSRTGRSLEPEGLLRGRAHHEDVLLAPHVADVPLGGHGGVFTAVPVTAFLMLLIGLRSTRPVEVTQARHLRVLGRTAPAPTVRARGELLTR